MNHDVEWFLLSEGSGSVMGNNWTEQVCYLGEERWLLSVQDDPAFSVEEPVAEDPEEYSSADLVSWAVNMDTTDGAEAHHRVRALLKVARQVGATQCEGLLREALRAQG